MQIHWPMAHGLASVASGQLKRSTYVLQKVASGKGGHLWPTTNRNEPSAVVVSSRTRAVVLLESDDNEYLLSISLDLSHKGKF